MGMYFVTDAIEGSARVSCVPGSSLEPKEEALFQGVLAVLRATEYAAWMNRRSDDGGSFNREPSDPYPNTPCGASSLRVPLEGLQGRGDIPFVEGREGERVAQGDVLRQTREAVCSGKFEEEDIEE